VKPYRSPIVTDWREGWSSTRRRGGLPTPLIQMIPSNYTPASDPATLANTGSLGGTWTRTYSYGGGTAGSSSVDATKLTVDAGSLFNIMHYSGLPSTGIAAGTSYTMAVRMGVVVTTAYDWDVVSELENSASAGVLYAYGGTPQLPKVIAPGNKVTAIVQYDGANVIINVDGSQASSVGAPAVGITGDIGRQAINQPRPRLVLYRYEVWASVVPIASIRAVYDAI
jgi:hypothetical protein